MPLSNKVPRRSDEEGITRGNSVPSFLKGERKLVTVLFADIVDSSYFVGDRDPEDANDILVQVIQILIDAVHRFGGTVNQVLGDGIMAVFGAPVAQEHHALRACLAASTMQSQLQQAFSSDDGNGPPKVQVRVGISSGEVIAQVIRAGRMAEYRLAGETVYLAARAEERAAPSSVFLTEHTAALASRYIKCRAMGQESLGAGKRNIAVYELVQVEVGSEIGSEPSVWQKSPFCGREGEIQILRDALEAMRSKKGQVVVLTGEAGIGKSRLVSEFLSKARAFDYSVIEAQLLPFVLSRTLEPFLQFIQGFVPIGENNCPPDAERMLARAFSKLGIGDASEANVLGEALDLLIGDPIAEKLEPSEKRKTLIRAIVQVMASISRTRPIIVVIEDFHRFDSDARLLAEELASASVEARILLLITARPSSDDVWKEWPNTFEHDLDPLSKEQSLRLLDALLGNLPELDDIKEKIVRKTRGNPLFLTECARAVSSSNYPHTGFNLPRFHRPFESVEFPITVHDVLAARVDSLPVADRSLLLSAAVIGETFDVGLLQKLAKATGRSVLIKLESLEAMGFIERTRVIPSLEFSFKHSLIHEVAYESLLRSHRLILHAELVTAIERRSKDSLLNKRELLAHHAHRAEHWPKAYVYCRAAGLKAQVASRNSEAAEFLTLALSALKELPESPRKTIRVFDLKLSLAHASFPLARYDVVFKQLSDCQELAKELGDSRRKAKIASSMTLYHWITGSLPDAVRMGRIALNEANASKDHELELLDSARLGAILLEHGEYESASNLLRFAVGAIPDHANHKQFGLLVAGAVSCRASLARCLGELGRFQDALQIGDEAISIADETRHKFSQIYANLFVGIVLLRKGDFERSIPLLEKSTDLCGSTRSKLLNPLATGALGYAYAKTGRTSSGLPLLDRALEGAETQGVTTRLPLLLTWLAETCLDAGHLDRALECANRALRVASENGENGHEAWASWLVGKTRSLLNPHDPKVEEYLRRALKQARGHNMAPLTAHCRLELGKHLVKQGADSLGNHEIEVAVGQYWSMDMSYWLKVSKTLLTRNTKREQPVGDPT